MNVTRFLVSGTDKQLMDFHLSICMLLNAIERRGETVLYTCMGEDRETTLNVGRKSGVTMQEWAEDTKKWNMIIQGEHPGWKLRKQRKKKGDIDERRN